MKKLFVLLVGFILFQQVDLLGQVTPKNTQHAKKIETLKIATPGIGCEICQKKVDTYLKRQDGIISLNINYKRGETTVKYATDRINPNVLRTAINNMGYDADDEKANPESYKRLPKTCKTKEDGGTHPERKTIKKVPETSEVE